MDKGATLAFNIDENVDPMLDTIYGTHPTSYHRKSVHQDLPELLSMNVSELMDRAAATVGRKRSITKKSYFVDRQIDLICHTLRAHPQSVCDAWIGTAYLPDSVTETRAKALLSFLLGVVFGRWDIRVTLERTLSPELPDPFAPLPVCSPGMLVGPDGFPSIAGNMVSQEWLRSRSDAVTLPSEGAVEQLTIRDSEYPIQVAWEGILVDDPDHSKDIVRAAKSSLETLWGDRAEAIEQEVCEILDIRDLRRYFRDSGHNGFWLDHVSRYSKSRRKAPIYWLLQSPKRNYGLWLYYHRLDPDILFKALHKYVEPKIRLEEGRLDEYEARRRSAGTAGREAKQAEKAVEKQEELLADLREFRDRLERAAKLHLRPDLNDGVVLNIAPLHELVPWKEAKSKWNELLSGKYEWSSIGKQLREKGMV